MNYWKLKFRRFRHGVRRASAGRLLALPLFALLILGTMTWGSCLLFRALAHSGDFPGFFRIFMAEKIMLMVSMVLFAMIVLSAMISTLNLFFLAADMPLLLSTPMPHSRLFRWKTMDTLLTSTAMAMLFFLPVLIGYAIHFGRGCAGLAGMVFVLLLFLLVAALGGIALGMVVPLFISMRRLQPALSMLGVLLISGVVVILRLAQPERFFHPGAIGNMADFVREFSAGGLSGTPFYWFSRALSALSRGDGRGFLLAAGLLAASACALWGLLSLFRRHLFLVLLDRVHSGRRRRPPKVRRKRIRNARAALRRKETLQFLRSPDQWSQLIIIVAITTVFILNIHAIPQVQPGMDILAAFLNMGMAAFVVAGLNSRFAFPAMAMEDRGLIHVLAAPVPREALLRTKIRMFMPPQALLGLAIFLAGHWILGLGGFLLWSGLIYLLPLLVAISLLAFHFGLQVLPGPNETPENLLLSRPGILFMLASLACIVLTLALFVYPIVAYRIRRASGLPPPWTAIAAAYSIHVGLMSLLSLRAWRGCRRLWNSREY